MVVPAGIAVRFYFSVNTQLVINSLDASVVGTVTVNQAFANALGAAIKSQWSSALAPQMHTTTQFIRVGVRDLRSDNLPEFRDTGAPVAGTAAASDPLPGQLALCVTKRTTGAGKSFRGRYYASGFSELANGSGGLASQAAADAVTTFLTNVGGSYSTNSLNPAVITMPQEEVIITKTTNHGDGSTEVKVLSHQTAKVGAVHLITGYQNRDLRWETIRRRNDGRGTPPSVLLAEGTLHPAMPPS